MTGWVIDYLDPDDYVLPIAASADVGGGDYFLTGIHNTTVDNATLDAAVTSNAAARAALYNIVWDGLNHDPNMIFVGQTKYVAFYRSNLHGFMFNPVTWYNFYYYWLD
jgi:ABC-type transport system substrate-binding protein